MSRLSATMRSMKANLRGSGATPRKGQARCVIKGYVAAGGNDAINESEFTGLERQAAVALVELFFNRLGMGRDHFVEDVVLVNRDGSESPPGAAEILAVRVDA